MTQERLLQAIIDAELTPEDLTLVLRYSKALVQREALKSAQGKIKEEQAAAISAAESKIQELQAQIERIEAQLRQV